MILGKQTEKLDALIFGHYFRDFNDGFPLLVLGLVVNHHEACLTVGEEAAGFFLTTKPTKRIQKEAIFFFFRHPVSMLRPLVVGCSLGLWAMVL